MDSEYIHLSVCDIHSLYIYIYILFNGYPMNVCYIYNLFDVYTDVLTCLIKSLSFSRSDADGFVCVKKKVSPPCHKR